MFETDISCSTFGNISPAHGRNINPKVALFFFFYQYALRLSVLNNELFCQKHLLSGHVGLLCFSPGFSDLSVIGAIMVVVKTVLR